MRRLVILGALALTLAGCGLFTKPPDTVTFERGKFFVVTFRMGQAYAVMKTKIEDRCASGKLDKAFCAAAAEQHKEFERSVTKPVLKSLGEPGNPVMDWEAVLEGVGIIADLAGKLL